MPDSMSDDSDNEGDWPEQTGFHVSQCSRRVYLGRGGGGQWVQEVDVVASLPESSDNEGDWPACVRREIL